MNRPLPPSDGAGLRQRAEEKLRAIAPEDITALTPEETRRLVHDLRVQRIELEIQNEELRTIQEDLETARARYADLYDRAPAGYFTLDESGRMREVNQTAAGLLGLSVLTVTGQPFTRFIVPEDQDTFYHHHRQLAATGQPQTCELRLHRPDGATFWARVESAPGRDSASGAPFCRAVFNDITAGKQAEAALRESEARLRLSVGAANVGLWDWNLATNEVYFSREWKSQIGYRDEEISNRFDEWQSRVHPDDLEPALARVRTYLAHPQSPHEVEVRLRHKDGSYRWILTNADVLRDANGKPVRMLGCHIDITERKQAEESLRESGARLKLLSRRLLELQETERRHLARDLHDEIGQALTAAKLQLQALERFPDPATQAKRLASAVETVDRLLNQVRALSLNLRPPLLEDLGLVPALRWLVDEQTKRGGLSVRLRHDELHERFDPGVETACFRVAQEALTNAARHAQSPDAVVEIRREGDTLQLTVRDAGVGFEPVAVQKRALSGGSLGLISMEERVLLAGGTIEIKSSPGQGTEIRAQFPARVLEAKEEGQ